MVQIFSILKFLLFDRQCNDNFKFWVCWQQVTSYESWNTNASHLLQWIGYRVYPNGKHAPGRWRFSSEYKSNCVVGRFSEEISYEWKNICPVCAQTLSVSRCIPAE
jgi:hypothetical protein